MSKINCGTSTDAGRSGHEGTRARSRKALRILHLGFEDPMMPGAGGGSVRTHEINSRLVAAGHQVTVLTTMYPDAEERCQDGVQYVPVGFGQGQNRLTRLLGYVLRLPTEVRHRRQAADLVVEDFFAPFSSMAAPLWAGAPTIGVVQWLHAKDKSREYKLPFHLMERAGVKTHRRMIAVSEGTAEKLRGMNPRAHVEVIGNGLDRRALENQPQLGHDILYIGRLELHGKGLDLLLDAWARASEQVDGNLIVAGKGPDEERIRRIVQERGLSERVQFTGWVNGTEKFRLLNSARLAVVPSRQETFGLVAIEALASGTPIIAFDIPCLKEVVPKGSGWLVEPFDAEALGAEIALRYDQKEAVRMAASQGRRFASAFDWDVLAEHQASAYHASVQLLSIRR
jgi:glycogen synthase